MSDESKFGELNGELELPPDLSDLEHNLRRLHLPNEPALDRDELMFQSGWAAALANENRAQTVVPSQVARWGWPVLTGTFATLSAALAIALFSPSAGDGEPVAAKPAAVAPNLVATPPQTKDPIVDAVDENFSQESAEHVFVPLIERVFRLKPSPSSALAMRNRMLRTKDLGEIVRPVVYNSNPRPQPVPLRAGSYKNQQIVERL